MLLPVFGEVPYFVLKVMDLFAFTIGRMEPSFDASRWMPKV